MEKFHLDNGTYKATEEPQIFEDYFVTKFKLSNKTKHSKFKTSQVKCFESLLTSSPTIFQYYLD